MISPWPFTGSLLAGPLCSTLEWPCTLLARCGDLRPRFLIKQAIRSRCRAIARNGRVLLCTDRPLDELPDQLARLRLQTWHRVYLPGDPPQPHGILLCVRGVVNVEREGPLFQVDLRPTAEAAGELRIAVGGGMVLEFTAFSRLLQRLFLVGRPS